MLVQLPSFFNLERLLRSLLPQERVQGGGASWLSDSSDLLLTGVQYNRQSAARPQQLPSRWLQRPLHLDCRRARATQASRHRIKALGSHFGAGKGSEMPQHFPARHRLQCSRNCVLSTQLLPGDCTAA